jgi:hypothetical protein
MDAARSDARNAANSATSSGCAGLPIGMPPIMSIMACRAAFSSIPLLFATATIMPRAPEVSMNPGEIMLIRTPLGPTSLASPLLYVIALGARLRRLNVPAIIIEKNERPGDSWRKRYKSLCLHDPVWYDHLPYLPFPEHWPVFSSKDKIADWLEMYTRVMELNYWGSTERLYCIQAARL